MFEVGVNARMARRVSLLHSVDHCDAVLGSEHRILARKLRVPTVPWVANDVCGTAPMSGCRSEHNGNLRARTRSGIRTY
jgi:hypothetical protein